MKFLFLLLFPVICQAQMNTLPEQVQDEPTANDLSYLSQQITNLTSFVNTLPTSTGTAPSLPINYVVAIDSETTGTAMAACSNVAYTQVTLNALSINNIGASIGGNYLTLQAGTYFCRWRVPTSNNHEFQSELVNHGNSSIISVSQSGASAVIVNSNVEGVAQFTLSSQTSIYVTSECSQATQASPSGFGPYEVYTMLECLKTQ